MSLLKLQDLCLSIHGEKILDKINFSVESGQIVAVVGESGSGKSMTASAVMQLLPDGAKMDGSIWLDDQELLGKSEKEMCSVRANDIGKIFKEPMTALNPVQTIGNQIMEAVKVAEPKLSKDEVRQKAEMMLRRVELPQSRFPLNTYPHKLSGGQRQRVVIAIAISQNPKLLIADEPTTALDVTTQAKIIEILKKFVEKDNMGLLLISHDLAVVAEVADHIIIMRNGVIVEEGDTATFFANMKHEYSKKLFAASRQNNGGKFIEDAAEIILDVKNLTKDYKLSGKENFRAVNNVSFSLKRGENLGLVGESGCGKSTLSRCILGVEDYSEGSISINGKAFSGQKELRRHINVVFQDPYGSFNPRHTVERLVAEPFYLLESQPNATERRAKVKDMLRHVGLEETDIDKYPHEFSGGQRQRIAIARALITEPSIILLDEATSALDVLIRKQILELLEKLSEMLGISYLFISHDLSTVKNITDRVLVMKDGVIIEQGNTQEIYQNPQHPYTKSLLDATPDIKKAIKKLRNNLDDNII